MSQFHPLDLLPHAARRWFPFPAIGKDPEVSRRAAEASRSLRRFIDLAWPILEPANPLISNWHLDAICIHLEAVTNGDIKKLLINVPPGHMKSLAVGVFWPAWEWITYPHRRWLFASYALSLSERDSVKCRRLIESPWYQQHFGRSFQLCGDQNTKLRYENDKSGHRIATSVGGSATGEGGDRVVVDDPHNVIDRQSNAKRTEALTWWDETMSTRLNDPKTGAKIIVMQRIHEKDLSGHVLAQSGYEHLFLPAEFEPGRRCVTMKGKWQDPRQIDGELLWCARIGPAEIADMKIRLGPESYAGQFQQRPTPAGGAVFRRERFRYYSRGTGFQPVSESSTDSNGDLNHPKMGPLTQSSGMGRMPMPGESESSDATFSCSSTNPREERTQTRAGSPCHRFAVMDPAGSEPGEGRNPCYTVIQVWDVTDRGEMFLVHQYRRQVQAPDAASAASRICREFDAAYIAIEKDGIGLGVVQQVRREGIAVRAIKARGCKEARTQTAEIRMAAGQVYFPQGASFLFELEEELLSFPNSEFSDQVDALSHAAMLVQKMVGPVTAEVRAWERDAIAASESLEKEWES